MRPAEFRNSAEQCMQCSSLHLRMRVGVRPCEQVAVEVRWDLSSILLPRLSAQTGQVCGCEVGMVLFRVCGAPEMCVLVVGFCGVVCAVLVVVLVLGLVLSVLVMPNELSVRCFLRGEVLVGV